jgi:DNA topoisomerase VI subunit A
MKAKSKIIRPRSIADDIIGTVQDATRKWTRQRKSEERHASNVRYRVLRMTKESRMSQRAAAWEVMEAAYMAASDNDRLPAKARQIFYRARPKIIEMTDDKELAYGYFSQIFLPDYVREKNCEHWKIVYDARGHLVEPHTYRRIGLGTLEIDNYARAMKAPEIIEPEFKGAEIDTVGSSGCFGAVVSIGEEGFEPLLEAVNLADRRDVMIMFGKGISVTAERKLLDALRYHDEIPIIAFTDCDFDGFKRASSLQRDSRRYVFKNRVKVIHAGLRFEDIADLEREPAAGRKMEDEQAYEKLIEYGATPEEAEFLLDERVELNALSSQQLVELIERKLDEHGVKKVIPDDDLLSRTYKAFHKSEELRQAFEEFRDDFEAEEITVPENLREQVQAILNKYPEFRWEEAVEIVRDEKQLEHIRDKNDAPRNAPETFRTVTMNETAGLRRGVD